MRPVTAHLLHGAGTLTIIAGMVADVDAITGSKTVFAHLTKPLTPTGRTALRER